MANAKLSFVQNPSYTASNYTKMSLKNSQAVKNLDFVDALTHTLILGPQVSSIKLILFDFFSLSSSGSFEAGNSKF